MVGNGTTLTERIDDFERRLRALESELAQIRHLLATGAPAPAEEPEPVAPAEVPIESAPAPRLDRPPVEEPAWESTPPAARWFESSHDLRPSDLLGARALAWAGGIVTLLGVVLFFALAVNRGWIGPGARVVLGAVASGLVFGGGLFLRGRFGETYSALAAVGAGIAGGYATLLAAGPYYDLLPDWAALVVAAAIGGVGLVISLRWSSELVAGLGLVGASVVPVPIAWGHGLTTTGTGFVAIVFAAAAVVAVAKHWETLLSAASIAVVPQVLILAGEHYGDAPAGPLTVAAACSGVLLAAGIGLHLRAEGELEGFQASAVLAGAVLACVSAALLFRGETREGVAFLAVAAVYGALSAVFFPRARERDLGALLFAVALGVAAIAGADLLSGSSLGIAWAAEAAVLAWLARRIGDARFQLGSLVYLLLAVGHSVVVDAPPRHLFVENAHPAAGVAAMIAVSFAAAVFAERCGGEWAARRPGGVFRIVAPLLEGLRTSQSELRIAAACLAGLGALYAASLGLMELPASFAWNHVAVTALIALMPLLVLVGGLVRRSRPVQLGAALGLVLALAKDVVFDLWRLDPPQRSWAMLAVGAALLLAGFLYQVLSADLDRLEPRAAAAIAASVLLGVAGLFDLLDGSWHGIDRTGAALLVLAGVYLVLAALVFRDARSRDLSTLLWGIALAVAVVSTQLLLSDTPLAIVWAGIAVALVGFWLRTGEHRFQLGTAAYLVLAAGHALIVDAPPTDFFESNRHPAAGAGAVAAAAIAAFALAFVVRMPEKLRVSRAPVFAVAGVLATYAGSLVILELFELGGRVETSFERGHAAVSAVWGVLALLLLYLGLTRRLSLRLAGFALFGVTLAKIFLYDLATLSPVARALSFLAVGAVLLLGGFFYQRLSSDAVGREETGGR